MVAGPWEQTARSAMVIRVGVVGAGIMGADHATTLHRWVSGAEVALVADLDATRAAAAAEAVGARTTTDPLGLVEDPGVDAVVIASSDTTHGDLIRACVRAGKPTLCEKPLTPSLIDSTALVTEIGTAGEALVSLGFMRRFDPGYTALKASIDAAEFGPPVLAYSIGRGVASAPGSTTASAVTNSMVHDLDTMPWLLGSPVTEVAWQAGRRAAAADGFDDPTLVWLRTANGVLTSVETFLNARYGYDIRCEVVGEHGTASLAEPLRVVTDGELRRSTGYAADWRPRFAEAYRLELQAWVDHVGQRAPRGELATVRDGLVASAVADAVIASARHGGRWTAVSVPEVSP